jgi:hypothetical protein
MTGMGGGRIWSGRTDSDGCGDRLGRVWGQVLGTHGEVVRRLKALAEGRMRHNKALLHALLLPGMQPGVPLCQPGQPAMHDGSGGPGHKAAADFRAPQPRMLVRPRATGVRECTAHRALPRRARPIATGVRECAVRGRSW